VNDEGDDRRLRALILEDEWVARNFLAEIVEATGLATVVGAVGAFDDAVEFLGRARASEGLDVVFVDVNLLGSRQSGLDLVRRFARAPDAPAFVLATALKEHAIEAFALGVVDYLLKPFDRERVGECLGRLRASRPAAAVTPTLVSSLRPPRIVARHKRNLVFLELPEVWAFEATEGLTLVHSERGSFDIDLSLGAVSASFGRHFARVHRNWLVNEEHVLEWEREPGESAIQVGGRAPGAARLRVPVARDRASALRARLVDESFGLRKR
jgi:two-component system, LytTR family, response regulator LytT